MYSVWEAFLIAGFIWLLVLSFLNWRQEGFLKSLFPKSGERDVRKKFEDIVNVIDDFRKRIEESEKKVERLEVYGLEHIQRIKLLRYNPYNDTGGDQSFSVAVLDGKGTGFVLTSLHTRSGTRVFAKPVSLGHNEKYEFSKEEKDVIKQALNKK